jgi:hypothetical protein
MDLASPAPGADRAGQVTRLELRVLEADQEGSPVRPGEPEDRAPGARLRVPDTNPARAEVGHLNAIAVVPAVRTLPPLDEIGRLRKVRVIPPVLVNPGGTALACFIVSGYHCYLAMASVRRPLPTEGSDLESNKGDTGHCTSGGRWEL